MKSNTEWMQKKDAYVKSMGNERQFNTILMVACTEQAWHLAKKTEAVYLAMHPDSAIEIAVKCRALPDISIRKSLREYVGKRFPETDAIVFFAAAGIAVRTIAPFVRDKYEDPVVLVIDESGRFCISLLSGHVGGANTLCEEIAEMIGAEPVITTATDRGRKFAVDSFAAERGLWISSHVRAKEVSARVVAGENVKMFAAIPGFGPHDRPETGVEKKSEPCPLQDSGNRGSWAGRSEAEYSETGLLWTDDRDAADIVIDVKKAATDRPGALYLVPKTVFVGIGCRKGKSEEDIESAVKDALRKASIFQQSVYSIASIDLKAEEAGLIGFAEKFGVPFRTFSAEELNKTQGDFTPSDFVRSVTGVDNVCERAAVAASGQGRLIVKKQKYEGVTVAAAIK